MKDKYKSCLISKGNIFFMCLSTTICVTLFWKPQTRDFQTLTGFDIDTKHLQLRRYGNGGIFTPKIRFVFYFTPDNGLVC